MKAKEKALEDMVEAIREIDDMPLPVSTSQRNQMIVSKMKKKGWEMSADTLHDTARSLGLTVVGTYIYGEDE
jgi:hypothetical protein